MTLPGFLERRVASPAIPDSTIVAHSLSHEGGWAAAISAGESVIVDARSEGLLISSDRAHRVGEDVRILVPGRFTGEPACEVRAQVIWCRRNPLPQFGRTTYGLAFRPPGQAEIESFLTRCRVAPARRFG